MKLDFRLIVGWPKLAWVARFGEGADTITVFHGPMVETGDDWAVEGVWAGSFESGDFDRTDLIFGSGVRIRDKRVIFVSPATAVDRLWYGKYAGLWHVSNSLPALMARAGIGLCENYPHYPRDIETIESLGLRRYVRSLPTDSGEVQVRYFTNLLYDGNGCHDLEKPDTFTPIKTFADYRDFLFTTARRMESNLSDPRRRHKIVPLVGISSGYDSPAAAVVARHAGCRRAVTIANSNSFWRGRDSGEEIARRLGMSYRSYRHDPRAYCREEAIWAAGGRSGGRNLALFDYPGPLTLFFNGSYGDKVWDRLHHDFSELIGDTDSLLCEFRLIQGMFHTVVPWWGIRHAKEIHAIGSTAEMAPWTLHNRYDRPIARRLIEEAGIPRGLFGVRKKNTSSNVSFLWPQSPASMSLFTRYLRKRGLHVPSAAILAVMRRLAQIDELVAANLTRRLGLDLRLRKRLRFRGQSLLFHWANEELKQRYLNGLRATDAPAPSSSGTDGQ